jgi:C1A family cysteine protease
MPRIHMRKHSIKRYGWIPDLPDVRDHLYAAPPEVLTRLPPKVDLRAQSPIVYDQGQLGSCTANAIAAAIQFDRMKQNLNDAAKLVPSRLFIYYNERVIEGTAQQDSGAQIRDGIKTVAKQGACFESGPNAWPYTIPNFTEPAPEACYEAALADRVVQYSRLMPSLNQLRGCLAAGYPFVFGFTVYQSFETDHVAKSGIVPMPAAGEEVVGGHAVMAVGYDDSQQRFIVRNSWGPNWGLDGYCLMPYGYLTERSLASDFWTIRMIVAPKA